MVSVHLKPPKLYNTWALAHLRSKPRKRAKTRKSKGKEKKKKKKKDRKNKKGGGLRALGLALGYVWFCWQVLWHSFSNGFENAKGLAFDCDDWIWTIMQPRVPGEAILTMNQVMLTVPGQKGSGSVSHGVSPKVFQNIHDLVVMLNVGKSFWWGSTYLRGAMNVEVILEFWKAPSLWIGVVGNWICLWLFPNTLPQVLNLMQGQCLQYALGGPGRIEQIYSQGNLAKNLDLFMWIHMTMMGWQASFQYFISLQKLSHSWLAMPAPHIITM